MVDQARDFSAPEVRGEVVEFINVSATAVSREDAKVTLECMMCVCARALFGFDPCLN